MVSKSSRSSVYELEMELVDAGKTLLHLSSSSSADIRDILAMWKKILSKVEQSPSESMTNALHPVTDALIAKELVRHPDMDVNISVACCFCEILRIYAPDPPYNDEQLKDIFEMVVITFEKLSSASGGCYTEMAEVLKIVSYAKLSVLRLDLDSDEYRLIVRLFKQFLAVADSNSSAIVRNMEEIMTTILEEGDELKDELVGLLVTFLKNSNRISSPVCWQLGQKVLMNFRARFEPHLLDMGHDMSIALYDYSRLVASICKTASENDDIMVSSYEGGVACVQGYKVKQGFAQILEAIFKKHGDIAADCVFKTDSVRSSILEGVCEVVRRIQTNDVIEKMEEIKRQVSDAKAANIDVSWLQSHLEVIHKRKETNLLMETKVNTILVKRAAQKDLRERCAELLSAQQRFKKAERFVKVLGLVEKNLNGNILESKAKLDSYAQQPFL